MTTAQRPPRLILRLLLWTIAGAGALALFAAASGWSSLPVRWTDLSGWLDDVTSEDALIEAVRWLGIVIAAYVTLIAGLGLLGELAAKVRLAPLARVLRSISMRSAAPVLRDRLWRTATSVAVSASAVTVSTGGMVGASAPPTPVELAVDVQADGGVLDGVDFSGFSSESSTTLPVDASVPVVVATPGDNLSSLIEAHYGFVDDSLIDHVTTANGISDPNHLDVGQIVAFPAVEAEIPDGAATWSSHQVVRSDTLWDILEAHYGYADADLVWHVAAANGLENPNELAVGQMITLPPVDSATGSSQGSSTVEVDNWVVVSVGDSLSTIAAAHLGDADRWSEIWDANSGRTMPGGRVFDDPNTIQPGWTLRLPTDPVVPVVESAPDGDLPDQAVDAPPAVAEKPAVDDTASATVETPDENAAVEDQPAVDTPSPVLDAPPVQVPVSDPLPAPTVVDDVDEPAARPVVVAPSPRPAAPGAPVDTVSQPGDRAATPPPVVDDPSNESAEGGTVTTITLAAGGLALAGLVALLDRRRRRRRSLRPVGRTVAPPPDRLDDAERVIRRAARLDIAERINAAIRSLGPHLATLPAPIRPLYVSADNETVTVVLDQELHPPAGWNHGPASNSWICTLDDDQLSTVAHDWTPWPAMIPLGTTPDGAYVLVDLEAIGILSLTGDPTATRSVLAALIVALSSSPFTEMMTVLDDDTTSLHRLDELVESRLAVADVDELIERLATWPSPLTDDDHLLAVRADTSPDCEPCIAAVATSLTDDQRYAIAELHYRTEPIAVITTDDQLGHTELVINSDHTTALHGQTVTCHHLDPIVSDRIADLIEDADNAPFVNITPAQQYGNHTNGTAEIIELELPEFTPVETETDAESDVVSANGHINGSDELSLPEVQLALDTDDDGPYWNVRVLGDLEIDHDEYGELSRDRRRELLTLLALNAGGLTSGQLGLQLFPPDDSDEALDRIKNADELAEDAKAAEAVVRPRISELRKALGGGQTADGHRYLPRAANSRYRAAHVRLDADHMFMLIDAAHRCTDTQHRINALAAALQLVRGPIGRGELTAWPWPSQKLADIEAGIIDTGLELAELATLQQNWKLADWAATRTQLANPDEQRGLPYAIRARQELGDRSGIQRLYTTTTSNVDELHPAAADAFHAALARQA